MGGQTQTKSANAGSGGDFSLSDITTPFVLRKEQPKAIETDAGTLRIVVAERPTIRRVETDNWIGYEAPDWQNKTIEYHALLRASYGALDKATYTRTGSAIIFYTSIAEVARNDIVLGAYLEKITPEHARVVLLSDFYPFGIVSERYNEYKNRGVGSALLKLIRSDCATEGASSIYCYAITPEMQRLVGEFGFEEMSRPSTFFLNLQACTRGTSNVQSRSNA